MSRDTTVIRFRQPKFVKKYSRTMPSNPWTTSTLNYEAAFYIERSPTLVIRPMPAW